MTVTSAYIAVAAKETPAKRAFQALFSVANTRKEQFLPFGIMLVPNCGVVMFPMTSFSLSRSSIWETTTLWLQVLKVVACGWMVSFCLI